MTLGSFASNIEDISRRHIVSQVSYFFLPGKTKQIYNQIKKETIKPVLSLYYYEKKNHNSIQLSLIRDDM